MPTLSVLHRRPIVDEEEEVLVPFLHAVPQWLTTVTSLPGGQSPLHFWSPQAMVRVLPDDWSQLNIQQLHNQWDFFRLSSLELTQEVYDSVIARIKSRSDSTPSPLVG